MMCQPQLSTWSRPDTYFPTVPLVSPHVLRVFYFIQGDFFFFSFLWNWCGRSCYRYFSLCLRARADWNISDPRKWQISFPLRQPAKLLNWSLCLCVWFLPRSSDVFNLQRILPCHCLKRLAKVLIFSRHANTQVALSLWVPSSHYIH